LVGWRPTEPLLSSMDMIARMIRVAIAQTVPVFGSNDAEDLEKR